MPIIAIALILTRLMPTLCDWQASNIHVASSPYWVTCCCLLLPKFLSRYYRVFMRCFLISKVETIKGPSFNFQSLEAVSLIHPEIISWCKLASSRELQGLSKRKSIGWKTRDVQMKNMYIFIIKIEKSLLGCFCWDLMAFLSSTVRPHGAAAGNPRRRRTRLLQEEAAWAHS